MAGDYVVTVLLSSRDMAGNSEIRRNKLSLDTYSVIIKGGGIRHNI